MSRIRTVKPEWLDDEGLHEAGMVARLMSVALITLADDYGNGRAHVGQLAGRLFWAEENGPEMVRDGLAKLVECGFLHLYQVRHQSYFHICNWGKHQRVDHPGKPRCPGPETTEKTDIPESLGKLSGNSRETLKPDLDPDQYPDHDHERVRARRAPQRMLSSLAGIPHPDNPSLTFSSEEFVIEAFKAVGRTAGKIVVPSSITGGDRRELERIERMSLETIAEMGATDPPVEFARLVNGVMGRYRDKHRDDPERCPWKAGFIASRWAELSEGFRVAA